MKTKLRLCVLASTYLFFLLVHNTLNAQTTIVSSNFETGTLEGWSDPGTNAFIFNSAARSCQGSWSVAIRGNTTSSHTTSPTFDAAPYASIDVSFCYQTAFMDNSSDGFRVEFWDGSTWITIGTYVFTVDIPANDTSYSQTITITPPTNFPANASVRFHGASTSTFNYLIVDDVTITGYSFEPQREIQITGNGVEIVDGDITPHPADDTDYGNVEVSLGSITKTFTINNLANLLSENLTLNSPYVSLSGSSDFSIASFPANNTIASGGSEIFGITFNPSSTGVKNATVTVYSDDADEAIYTFDITGNGVHEEFTFFYENFDTNNGGWTSSGSGTTWAWGTGPNTSASEALEGNVWYTNSYNDYGNNTNTAVTSNIISTLGYQNITFSLDVRYKTDVDPDDGMHIEYRKRTSGTWSAWSLLGTSTSGTNWYTGTVNALSADGWAGDSNDGNNNSFMETASIDLPNILDNSAEIQFRVTFASDNGNRDDGAYFDNLILKGEPTSAPLEPSLGPGDVTTKLRLWLKADSEVGTLSDNSDIITWNDEAYDNDAIAIATDAPSFRDNATDNINFNPTIRFDRSNTEFMRGKGGFASKDYYVVVYTNNPVDNSGANRQVPIAGRVNANGEFAVDGTGLGLGSISARFTNEVIAHMIASVPDALPTDTAYGRAFTSTTESVPSAPLIFNVRTNAAGTQTEIYQNGEQIDDMTGVTRVSGETLPFSDFKNVQYYLGVGRFSLNGNVGAYVDGRMSEIISYDNINTAAQQQRIQSYLGLKYGITLKAPSTTAAAREGDIDYIDSNGDLLWDVSDDSFGFNYDIAGIGRDDNSGLYQKQSRTSNSVDEITISLGEIYATNSANPYTFSHDRDFLVWGNDGGSLSPSGVTKTVNLNGAMTTFTEIVNRKWKIVERTNGSGTDIGNVFVSIPFNTLDTSYPKGPNQEYALLVSSGAAFGPSDIVDIIPFTETAGSLDVWYDFDGTRYFTVGVADRSEGQLRLEFTAGDYLVSNNTIDLNSDFTISNWVRNAGSGGTVFAKDTDYELRVTAGGTIELDWNGSTRISSAAAINDGRWHHVSVVKNGSTATLYIDGVQDGNASVVDPVGSTSSYFSIGVVWANKSTISTSFDGDIDEIRIWDTALTLDQLRYIMNQEIESVSSNVEGTVIPTTIAKNDISGMPWSNLQVYYDINSFYGSSIEDKSDNGNWARIKYLAPDKRVINAQTAPLPYRTNNSGSWATPTTWFAGSVLPIPGTLSIVDGTTSIDWNIVQLDHDVTLNNTTTVLGMFSNSNELAVQSDNGLTVSHYLRLDGTIDLEGESQLVQQSDSELDVASGGHIERDQQGSADAFTYNFWGVPVGRINTSANNVTTNLSNILLDGSTPTLPQAINFQPALNAADGGGSNPITISTYWLYKYVNSIADDYYSWLYVGDTGNIEVGEGFTMKGSGNGGILTDQNYVFRGKPNNGVINALTIAATNEYLVGNPYPSALDAHEFIDDNTHTTGTLYFWHHWGGGSHVTAEYQGGYATRTKAGGVQAYSHPDADPSGAAPVVIQPGRYVPVAQGFFVEANTTGNITFENDQRQFVTEATSSSTFVRGASANDQAAYQDLRPKLRLGFNSTENFHRQVLLTIDPETTTDVDWGYEGASFDESNGEDMLWRIEDQNYVIQAIPEITEDLELDLVVETDRSGTVEIMIDTLENFADPIEVYLLDDETEITYNLTSRPAQLRLEPGSYTDRFTIVFAPGETLGIDDIATEGAIQMAYIKAEQELKIRSHESTNAIETVALYNVMGQRVNSWSVNGLSADLDVSNLGKGVYIIKTKLTRGTITKKVIIE